MGSVRLNSGSLSSRRELGGQGLSFCLAVGRGLESTVEGGTDVRAPPGSMAGREAKRPSQGGALQGKVPQEPRPATLWHIKGKSSGYSGGLEMTAKGCHKGLWVKSEPWIWARALDSHKWNKILGREV